MANPNIVNTSILFGKTSVLRVNNTFSTLVTNSANSGKIIKVSALYIANMNAANSGNVTLDLFRSNISYPIMANTNVPAASTVDVVNKLIYLEEGDTIRVFSNTNNMFNATISYEEIS
jgi:hypothetical protein